MSVHLLVLQCDRSVWNFTIRQRQMNRHQMNEVIRKLRHYRFQRFQRINNVK